ncbi:hypothetical protein HWV01_13095 [Moritella sp. 5]|uniref:hypothetical protein n=1 Tax=Moritella sp. 5 TaxID=2746231 RepID=UPI001BA8A944|nr:hypothetical protein [Moritella sp. 5]QUM81155.1 hypothetical protein HWV01_13095 [Moritella sp. 5]
MQTIETYDENSSALSLFRQRLEDISYRQEELEWGFPNGDRVEYLTYSIETHLGELQVGVPESWESRIPHLVRFAKEQGPPSPDVELNIPTEINRRVSGLYAKSNDEIWLCSRGSFTAFRGQIKRNITLSHFDKWLCEVNDAGKQAQVIPVCSLSSSTMANDIATFTAAVQELKQLYKDQPDQISSSTTDNPSQKFPWGSSKEFEGKKNSGSKDRSEYDYIHGPLCNQLKTFLEKNIHNNEKYKVTKNVHVDVAIINKKTDIADSIFEVKTASLPSNQIYTAVGQILYYKRLYGDSNTRLYIVVPLNCKSLITEGFIEGLGIQLVYGEAGQFILPNGDELAVNV